ncbi:hypothetical protein O7635_28040 [Asanoa sp. WMMD1127]|uniref:hypothetical protein n=1 Tax=Asanoa sp. WMMD1127 TaxID=3016107 RepID=UPI0024163A54|nr:hypothetical protein [Asanoa sp. WMMD1127]MDG4825715.1 hypothetical protein [Asanoa sp. WMMD1127]
MTVDERVRAALQEVATDVRSAPDPYGRLRIRRTRVRRRRIAVAGAALAVVAAVTVAVPQLPEGDPTIGRTEQPQDIHGWAERLRLSPARGAVGASDPRFVADLTRLVGERQRAGAYQGVTDAVSEVNVLYVDDVGAARVAFVAFHLAVPDPVTAWENANAWLVARPGASAAELADPAATAGIGDGLEPFEVRFQPSSPGAEASAVAVGLAPAGCVVESAPLPAVDTWTAEPTGSYVVRDAATERAEWWRVVCDGVVKEERPAPTVRGTEPVTDAELEAAVVGARGQVDREQARETLDAMRTNANQTTGPARVLWGGVLDGAKAAVVTTPGAGGGWHLRVGVGDEVTGTWVAQDPADPDIVLPVQFGGGADVLVLVPDGVRTVRAVRDGTVIDSADVRGRAATLLAPDAPRLTFEALDTAGAVVGTGKVSVDPPPHPDVVPW